MKLATLSGLAQELLDRYVRESVARGEADQICEVEIDDDSFREVGNGRWAFLATYKDKYSEPDTNFELVVNYDTETVAVLGGGCILASAPFRYSLVW